MAQATFNSIAKTVSATGTPEVLGSEGVRFHSITFFGLKAARTDNTGRVWLQVASGNDTNAIPLDPGDSVTLTAKVQDDYHTADQIYIDVETAGDGVIGFYNN